MNSDSSLNDARLDRAIDRAVREMMQIDPAPGLRRRVLSRLNAPIEHRPPPLMRYAFAALALAVFVLSVTLMRDRVEPPTPPKAPPIVATGVPPVGPPMVPAINEPQPRRAGTTSAPITREGIPMPRVTNVFGNRRSEVSAATDRGTDSIGRAGSGVLRSIAPETLAPLAIVPLSARPIVIDSVLKSANALDHR
jgi:hypothetical protein